VTAVATSELVDCRGVSVVYGVGGGSVSALTEVDFVVQPRQAVALWGPSGSGKTTLLHVLGGLVVPTRGSVHFAGSPLSSLGSAARGWLRAAGGIAYVFQGANLLPSFTAFENVALAQSADGTATSPDAAEELLELVGLSHKLDSLPAELSGGEAQRVAIARALGARPRLLLCDEPTGQLDSDTGRRMLDLLDALCGRFELTLVIATHDPEVATRCERIAEMADGRILCRADRG
jgi:predicted ABC-type transport system involved in lysophospholipase L1 biosynthesis ATPase subunit